MPRAERTRGISLRSPADLRRRRVLVMGLGTLGGGTEAVKWLVRHGADVTVTDLRAEGDLRVALDELKGLSIRTVLGEHRTQDLEEVDLLVRNPAVPAESPFLAEAQARHVPVVMDTSLFFQFCPAPIAAVTGTRGKSTAVAVAGEILRRSRPDTVVAGNIQRSPLADLDRTAWDTPVVLELSSWQLEGIVPLARSPHWAVLTTILSDHLNRYPSFDAYVSAKEPIVRYQTGSDIAVLPIDDGMLPRFARLADSHQGYFGILGRSVWPLRSGLYRRYDEVLLVDEGREERVVFWDELGGRGEHTRRNMLAGALLALEMGASLADVRVVLREFRGLPNRLEVIEERDGRTFVNDTTATTPDAVIAGLRAFPHERVVLITGGTDKKLDYGGLAQALARATNLRALVLLQGSATEKLKAALGTRQAALGDRQQGETASMAHAVRLAWEASRPGDVIVLSPGAASFELFRDEFDRGDQFRAAVASLFENRKAVSCA